MDVVQAIEARRAVQDFDPNQVIGAAEVDRLLTLARLSPTAFNLQHCRFVVVDDSTLRAAIRAAAWDQAQMTDAALLVVVCADLKAWSQDPAGYCPPEMTSAERASLAAAMADIYGHNPQLERDEALRTCGIAAMGLMLAAQGLGYDSCPLSGFDAHTVARLIALPADHLIGLIVAVGKARNPPPARGPRLPAETVVIRNRFA